MNDKKTVREYFDEFILYKHSLGYVYETQEHYLGKYISFIESSGISEPMQKEAVDKYLVQVENIPGVHFGTVCVMREFSRYLLKIGIDAYLIPPKVASQETPNPPYFFTDEEICNFFESVDSIEPFPGYEGREIIIPAFFRIMYCCGLRCKETRLLRCENVSISNKYLDVMQSKGSKNRRIYISTELSDYLELYDRKISFNYPGREYFFPGKKAPYLGEGFVCGNFRRYWKQAYPEFSGERYPRAYDFRHHFAYANINRWAADGLDVNAMLPYLMRYMGHQSIKSTLYYFHFVPDFYTTYRELAEPSDDIIPEVPE